MSYILATSIGVFSQVLQIIIIVKVILSYFLDPYHPVRSAIDRLVDPLLDPIRRVMPTVGMFDFSPLILIILVQLIAGLLIKFL
jgi:YggT family protein